jgi:hypothetical protein
VLSAILGASAWVHVPRAVLAVVRDDEDAELAHFQCLTGNRLPPSTPGRTFRIEGVQLPDLDGEPVTRVRWEGESTKDAEAMLTATREPSKSAVARELILDTLESAPGLQMESDALDALVHKQTGLAVGSIKNQRTKLKDAGLVKMVPEKDELGAVERWLVRRTHTAR